MPLRFTGNGDITPFISNLVTRWRRVHLYRLVGLRTQNALARLWTPDSLWCGNDGRNFCHCRKPTSVTQFIVVYYTNWAHISINQFHLSSIPDGVTGIFQWLNPSGRTMALGSSQPLTEMSTRNLSWGKDGRCVGLTTLPPSCADCLEILGVSTSWSPKGQSRPVQGWLYLYLNKSVSFHYTQVSLTCPPVLDVISYPYWLNDRGSSSRWAARNQLNPHRISLSIVITMLNWGVKAIVLETHAHRCLQLDISQCCVKRDKCSLSDCAASAEDLSLHFLLCSPTRLFRVV